MRETGIALAVATSAKKDEAEPFLNHRARFWITGLVRNMDRTSEWSWMEKEKRFSVVTSDPRAIDLECFAELPR